MFKRGDVSHEFIINKLNYDSESGLFFRSKDGKQLGWTNVRGYRELDVKGIGVLAHRLAWFYVHGEWPNGEIDHINGIKNDNRICNLRVATRQQNNSNLRKARKDNRCGFLGVSFDKQTQRYKSRIRVNKKLIVLGFFKTPEKAHEVYLVAKRELHEFCTI